MEEASEGLCWSDGRINRSLIRPQISQDVNDSGHVS